MSGHSTVWQESAVARWYLESMRGAVPFAREQFATMVQCIEAGPRPVQRFLDLGAGDGALSAVLLANYPTAQAVLVDFSPPMLEAASERLAASATPPVIVEADLADPRWRDAVAHQAPFDAIVSGFAIHHLADERKQILYAELLPLLAPGGTFVNIEHVAPEAAWVSQAFDDGMIAGIVEHAARQGRPLSRADAAAAYANRRDQAANVLAPLETQCAWLREAGFVEVAAPFRWLELAVFGGRRPI